MLQTLALYALWKPQHHTHLPRPHLSHHPIPTCRPCLWLHTPQLALIFPPNPLPYFLWKLRINSYSEIKRNVASIFRHPKIHHYLFKSLYLSSCKSEWKQIRWERRELWDKMLFISEGPNYRWKFGGQTHHLEKMLYKAFECSLGALVTSWFGRSEN